MITARLHNKQTTEVFRPQPSFFPSLVVVDLVSTRMHRLSRFQSQRVVASTIVWGSFLQVNGFLTRSFLPFPVLLSQKKDFKGGGRREEKKGKQERK